MTDPEIEKAVTAFRHWLMVQRDAEFAEWRFTLRDQRGTLEVTERARWTAPEAPPA